MPELWSNARSAEVTESAKDMPRQGLRGKACVLLLKGQWFDSSGLHVDVSLGKKLNPKLLLMWSAPCMANIAISV